MQNIYFITCTILKWTPIFTREKYFRIIIKSLEYFNTKNLAQIYSFVVMENHVHLIVGCEDPYSLTKSFKMFTARKIIDLLKEDLNRIWILNQLSFYKFKNRKNSDYQLWEPKSKIKLIESTAEFTLYKNYINNNPIKAGYVTHNSIWKYSSNNHEFEYLLSSLQTEF